MVDERVVRFDLVCVFDENIANIRLIVPLAHPIFQFPNEYFIVKAVQVLYVPKNDVDFVQIKLVRFQNIIVIL
jgi:hypothetical protein